MRYTWRTAGAGAAALIAAITLALALREPAPAEGAKPKYAISQHTFQLSTNHPTRYQVYCPGGYKPLGGGMVANPPVAADGAGAYPTSSERLGVQHGWHVTAVRIGSGRTFDVTLQVFCRKPFKSDFHPVETTFRVPAGQSASQVVKCPHGRKLVSGGYLGSTLFATHAGYTTESRQISNRAWRVSGYGLRGGGGGIIIAIAYCLPSGKPWLTELSSTSALSTAPLGSTTAPSCPTNHPLAVGGFSEPAGALRFFDTGVNSNGDWSVSAQRHLSGGDFTAYAYCLRHD